MGIGVALCFSGGRIGLVERGWGLRSLQWFPKSLTVASTDFAMSGLESQRLSQSFLTGFGIFLPFDVSRYTCRNPTNRGEE